MAGVQLGYFENFKGDDTLLLEGDADGLRHLVTVLRSLESGSVDGIEIGALPFVGSHGGVLLSAKRSHHDVVARVELSSTAFTWERTEAGWRDAADKVEQLVECEAGHQCLDSVDDQVVIEVSKGEYGTEWWNRESDRKRGYDAYWSRDYVTALRLLLPCAEGGDADAQCAVASMYELGYGVEPDGIEAVRWYVAAANGESALACYNLWSIYTGGRYGVEQDKKEARRWYDEAKRRGFRHLPREFY